MLVLGMFLFSFASFVYAQESSLKGEIRNQINSLKDDFQQLKEKRQELKQDIKNLSITLKELMKETKEARLELENKNVTFKQLSEEQKEVIANKINAKTGLNLSAGDINNKTMLRAYLSNGKNALIKIMPDTASAKAIERLKLKMCNETNNCTIELKETRKGDKIRAVYEIKAKKEKHVFFLWKKKVDVKTEVDAETGEVSSS
jgi:septal ring factor EnvC (AmiA/AmiB activator)